MPYCDLLRMTTLLSAGAATVLAAITILSANSDQDTTTLIVALSWWSLASAIGIWLGRPRRAADAVRDVLADAKTKPTLPSANPNRVAIGRMLPVVAFALLAGVAGIFLPGVSAMGAGFAIAAALAGRSREGAVAAIEERDGVRFYLETSPAVEPIKLIRTPGLRRGRSARDGPGFE